MTAPAGGLLAAGAVTGGAGEHAGCGAAALAAALRYGGGGEAWAPPGAVTADGELLAVQLLQPLLRVRVVTELPADLEHHLPIVQVTETPGGVQLAPAHDTAVLDYDGYAGSRTTAKQIAAQARAVLLGAAGYVTADGGSWVNRVVEVRRPTLLAYDDASDIRRYGGAVRLHIRYRAP
jgi:hypothetical protein